MQSRSKASDTGSGLPLYPGGRWRPGPVRFGATAPESLVITMPDGVRLDARISWPADPATGSRTPGLFPVVAELTPYTHTGLAPVGPLSFFPEHGYGHLVVNVRGSGASEGDIQYLSPLDGEDGVAIVDFAAKQLPGSDGRLALIGCSYPAGVALTTAAHLPAGSPVKVIVASCNGFHSQNRGSFLRSGIDTGNVEAMEGLLPRMMGNSASSRSFFTSLATEIKAGGPAAYDGEFWRERLHTGLATRIVASRIPILLWSGWRDHVEGAIRTFTALQNAFCGRPLGGAMEEGQEVSPLYQLLMTDGAHTEGLDLGLYLQWIETWLKNCDTGLQDTATPMHLFEVGSGRWVNLERFPATDLATCWALSPDGTLTRDAVPEADLTLVRDASDALLRFETPPFEHGATLAGPISASL